MDGDGNDIADRSTSMSSTTMACRRKERIFFLLLRVFLIITLFFTSSTDFATYSFDHLCKEPTKMKIEK
jgi:hypothetical protein